MASGTYPESISLLGKRIVVTSEQGSEWTTIDAEGHDVGVLCYMGESEETVVEGFRITHAGLHAIVCTQGVAPTFRDLRITENYSTGATCTWSSPRFYGVFFEDNEQLGIWAYGSDLEVDGCIFRRNRYGAVWAEGQCTLNLSDCWFDGQGLQPGPSYARALWAEGFSLRMSGCVVSNHDDSGTPVVAVNEMASVQILSCAFQNNSHTTGRSAVNFTRSAVTLSDCEFTENSAAYGGGCYFYDCSVVSMDSCSFLGNSASVGGGVYVEGEGDVTISGCSFLDNSSGGEGGAINFSGGGSLEAQVTHSLFAGNTTTYGSPALSLNHCSASIDHITIYDCTSASGSAMIWTTGYQDTDITACIVAFCDGIGISTLEYTAFPAISYCDIFECAGGSYGGVIPDLTGYNGNISADPMLCDPGNGDFRIAWESPCTGAGPGGTHIGAFGVGCSITAVTEKQVTWGSIKAMFR